MSNYVGTKSSFDNIIPVQNVWSGH